MEINCDDRKRYQSSSSEMLTQMLFAEIELYILICTQGRLSLGKKSVERKEMSTRHYRERTLMEK